MAPPPLVLSPLARGDGWIFMNGLEDADGHVRTLIPTHAEVGAAQRFAADSIRVGPEGYRRLTCGAPPRASVPTVRRGPSA
jgi:hypothetical protein